MFVLILVMIACYLISHIVLNGALNEAAETADIFDELVMISWCFMFTSITKISFLQIDNMSKWNMTVHTLPYKRSEIVSVEYIGVLFLQMCISLLYLLVMMILKILGRQYGWDDIFSLLFVSAGLGMIPMVLFYPIITRMKPSGAMPIFGGACGFISVIGMFAVGHFYEKAADPLMFSLIFFVSSAVLFAFSWLLSLRIMKNKDII